MTGPIKSVAKEAPKDTPKAKPRVRTKAPTTMLHHCYTGVVFTSEPVEMEAVDSWTQSQIDAGKLELC